MKTYFLTYSNDKYREFQNIADNFAKSEGFDIIISKHKEDILSSSLYPDYANILDYQPGYGDGYFLWKPYIILETLNKMEDGDMVIYSDVGDKLEHGIKNFTIDWLSRYGYLLVQNSHNHALWTKRDCFHYMDCDTPEYWDAPQLEAGFCGFVKNESNIKFVEEWLHYAKNPDIILTKESVCGLPEIRHNFKIENHRHDQSILTNLRIKYKMNAVDIFSIMNYIKYNHYK